MPQIPKTVRLVAITGFVGALCFTGFASRGDDKVSKALDQAATLEDVFRRIVEENTATLLKSLHVGKGVEMSLWETVLSAESLTPEESAQFDGNVKEVSGALLVQLIVPSESATKEKRRLVPLAEGVHVLVSYDVLKREVDRPIASTYYVDTRRSNEPRLQVAAFFVFDIEKGTWRRVPNNLSK